MPGGVPLLQRVYGIDVSGTQHYLRPPLVGPYGCENVLIEGVTLTRSPFWQLHPLFCKNVIVRNATMNSLGTNNDGCDVALRFKTNTRRGGVMRNYYARNIQVPNGVSANNGAITIDYFYRVDAPDDPAESGPYRPFTDQIYISNLTMGRGTKSGTKAFNIRGFGANLAPVPSPSNFVANTPRAGVAGSVGINDAIGVVRIRNSTFNVSTAPDVVQNVDLRLESVTINRS